MDRRGIKGQVGLTGKSKCRNRQVGGLVKEDLNKQIGGMDSEGKI